MEIFFITIGFVIGMVVGTVIEHYQARDPFHYD